MTRRILESGWGLFFLLGCTSEVVDAPLLSGGTGGGTQTVASAGGGAGGAASATTSGAVGSNTGGLANAGRGGVTTGGAFGSSGSGGKASGGSAGTAGGAVNGGATNGGGSAKGGNAGVVCAQTNQTSCSGFCVDTTSNASNCGACNQACATGATCVAGQCTCASGQLSCSSKCVDAQSDLQNCGACGNACSGAVSCTAGQCVCASGKTLCTNSCADLLTDSANCGVCGTKCGSGQACSAGQCIASKGGATGADGCVGLAQNITLSSVFAYQTVEVPVMKAGAEVAVSARNTDVVAGRDTVFRLFVTVGSGWTARPLSGRVFVDNGGVVDVYSSKKNVSATSQPATLDSTFQIVVPKEKITVDTKYQVELVECGTGSGTAQSPRFPTGDAIALGARQTGTLKIKVLPLMANGMLPDTTDAALAVYKALFLAMYPIASVNITVGTTVNVPDDHDWNGILDQVAAQRRTDKPANDVYYYGMMKPAATLKAYCGMACTAGIGFVVEQGSASQQAAQRAALGLAFSDELSAETMAHEVGHNHGRYHAPCVQGGSISDVDSKFPYSGGHTGVYGWDLRNMTLLPPTRTDIMGYCQNQWISDYNYDAIMTRVTALNGAAPEEIVSPDALKPWRVILLDDRGVRWGIPISEPALASGSAELAEVLDSFGRVIEVVEVYRTRVSDIDAFSLQVPEPKPGWFSIQVAGAAPLAYAR
jgi:hypothetical protein